MTLAIALGGAGVVCAQSRSEPPPPTTESTSGQRDVRAELSEACSAIRATGIEGDLIFRRTTRTHYRCGATGALEPVSPQDFRRARWGDAADHGEHAEHAE